MKPKNLITLNALKHMRVALIGMSGVGKTRLADTLRKSGEWYHYSVDYRIGSNHLAEKINDDLRGRGMRDPVLANLLRADGLTIRAKLGFNNLDAISAFLGKLGDPASGGLAFGEFMRRQELHAAAERAAMADTDAFLERGTRLYGYPNFVCDTSGSLCSVVDPDDPNDPILSRLAARHLIIVIEASESDLSDLLARFAERPKPLYYSSEFFRTFAAGYLGKSRDWSDIDPDDFATWAYSALLRYRAPRYRTIGKNWGYCVPAASLQAVRSSGEFMELVGSLIHGADAENIRTLPVQASSSPTRRS
ncbi:MAG: ATPase [Nitrospiraceae bacterium]|nr:ATPase [Nitrospiraceae bacterium]